MPICVFFINAQKSIGGKIYDKHPSIDVVDAFTKAFVAGDEATMRSLITEDFRTTDLKRY